MSRRPRRRLLTVLALLIAAAAVVVVIGVSNHGPQKSPSDAGTTATGAATVKRRDLVATDTESGTFSYAAPQTVFTQLPGTVTWLPAVGKVIRPGHALLTINNSPVLLLDGSTPAYRELKPSDPSGLDVYELNRNLVTLGYEPEWITVDDVWQPGTTAAVKELQKHLGEPQTGSLTLGRVVFLPGPQMVQSQILTVGSTTVGQGSAEVLSTSATKLVVTVDVSASSQSEATIGEHVTVQMPNGSTQNGKVTAVSPVAQSSSSGNSGGGGGVPGSGSSTVPVTVELNKPAKGGGLDQASVSVNFVQSKAPHVLSVPVTALLATSGSTFAVQEASSAHRLISVTTGLFAAGYVQISGAGIYPGLRVTDSQG